ncbi:hypothetical protein [Streptomyces guryensis]|uniref:Nuclear transport factor 2 family protein n=1 Tax=Streptomyces guryensis TaxID=2886947 RepID=A0A9Q3VUJ9_9ACTN|nr:hypothetical protein [Streptomyces guryensis]MCD9877550.1 hypothetical protein [Streptomyces guryensis]
MSWTRGLPAALAVCVLLLTGSVSCGSSDTHEGKSGDSISPVGKLLDDTDKAGRHYREVRKKGAPEVGIEVQPDSGATWDVSLTVRNFRFSPIGTKPRAVAGRGLAYVFVDDRLVARLRGLTCRLPARFVPHGTHHVTARLYADDGTVWAVQGRPVESTADITASEAAGAPGATPGATALGASGTYVRAGGRGSPERSGTAS